MATKTFWRYRGFDETEKIQEGIVTGSNPYKIILKLKSEHAINVIELSKVTDKNQIRAYSKLYALNKNKKQKFN